MLAVVMMLLLTLDAGVVLSGATCNTNTEHDELYR